jgi:hypothetical protein
MLIKTLRSPRRPCGGRPALRHLLARLASTGGTPPGDKDESTLALIRRLTSKQPKNKAAGEAAPVPERFDRVTIRRLIGLARPEAVPLGIGVATLGLTSSISLLFPFAIGQVLDVALSNESAWSPAAISSGLLGLFVVQSGLIVLRSALLTICGERISARMRKELFRSFLSQVRLDGMLVWDSGSCWSVLMRLCCRPTSINSSLKP